MTKIVKTVRFKLLPPDYDMGWDNVKKKESWKNSMRMVRDVSWQVAKIKNAVISKEGMRVLEIKRTGEKLPYVKAYQIARDMVPLIAEELLKRKDTDAVAKKAILSTQIMSACARASLDNLKGEHATDFWNGRTSLPTFRNDCGINMSFSSHQQGTGKTSGAYYFVLDKDRWCVRITLFAKLASREAGYTGNLTFNFPIRFGSNGSVKTIFKRLISNQYKCGSAVLNKKNGEIYLNCSYSFEKDNSQYQPIPQRVLGFDLRWKVIGTCSCSDDPRIKMIIHDEIAESVIRHRFYMEKRRNRDYAAMKPHTQKARGHGVKNKMAVIESYRTRESDFQKTVNHQISSLIVSFAKKNNCSYIALEDLTGIYESRKIPSRWLRRWAFYQLQNFVEYKSREQGIKTIYVRAEYTSQQCSQCGHTHEDNLKTRKNKSVFRCVECNYSTIADYNASQNIARSGFELLK